MDRRKSLKIIAGTALAGGAALAGCNPGEEKQTAATPAEPVFNLDRNEAELKHEKEILSKKFFNDHEMATITVLGDIIIPKDDISGSASDAKVPEFIEFIVKDMPTHQTPMRGGLRWLDMQCLTRYEKAFVDCTEQQRLELVDQIAYPERKDIKPEMKPGVAFFTLMRDLTATGFYTSAIGVKDLDYQGGKPNKWNGVPADVLAQYNLSYIEKELKECVSFE